MKNTTLAKLKRGLPVSIVMFTCLLAGLPLRPANAATIANTDRVPHTVTVENTTPPQVYPIPPQSQKSDLCPTGCVVKLDGREDRYIIEGGELLSIEDGTLYYDGDLPKTKVDQPEQ